MIRLERVPVRDGGLQRLAGPLGRPDRGKAGRSDRSIGTATTRARQNSEKQAELRNRRPIVLEQQGHGQSPHHRSGMRRPNQRAKATILTPSNRPSGHSKGCQAIGQVSTHLLDVKGWKRRRRG